MLSNTDKTGDAKNLRTIAVEEKRKGNTVKKGYNFLMINNEKWKWNDKSNGNTKQEETN